MREDHASAVYGEYNVPLIGIPKSATEEKCEVCKETFHMSLMAIDTDGKVKCKDHLGK